MSNEYLEIEKKYLLTTKQVISIEILAEKLSLSKVSDQYEKNQNFDNNDTFEKEDARLRLRTKTRNEGSIISDFEFTYKKRISIEKGIKKETELNYNFSSEQSSKNLIAIFKIIGLSERDSYERIRKTYANNNIQLTIDEFPFGYIIELEGQEDKILDYEKKLGMENYIHYEKSCDDVYKELCVKKGVTVKKHITFDDLEMPQLEDYISTWEIKSSQ